MQSDPILDFAPRVCLVFFYMHRGQTRNIGKETTKKGEESWLPDRAGEKKASAQNSIHQPKSSMGGPYWPLFIAVRSVQTIVYRTFAAHQKTQCFQRMRAGWRTKSQVSRAN